MRKVARSQPGDIYGSTESLPQVIHLYIVYIVHKKVSFDLQSHTYTVHMYCLLTVVQAPLRGSTPALLRYPSEDSFLVRKEQRMKVC